MAAQPPEDLPDLHGVTVVVTGASAGIGAAAARRLHRLGATVVPVGRSAAKTRAVADGLGVAPELVDFADLASVRELARRLLDRCARIDVLANNAGGTWTARHVTVDGHEQTFQVNHLAPFLLTGLLHERLTESAGRVITTSSGAHRFGRLDLGDLDSERGYQSQRVYGTSKLANILFTRELARRSLEPTGPSVGSAPRGLEPSRRSLDVALTATCYHPGFVKSEFGRDSRFSGTILDHAVYRFARTPEQGADTLAWLAAAPPDRWRSGGYYAKRRESGVSRQATDDLLARQLWDRCAALVGLRKE